MTIRKLPFALLTVSGLAQPALVNIASADVGSPTVTRILGPSENDLAETTADPPRLKRDDEEQPGAEMSHLAMFADNKTGLYFEMRSGELNGQLPPNKMQLAAIPFSLTQNADGSVGVTANVAAGRFVTNNDGNETRNANHPIAYAINGGNVVCAEYNYQPDNDDDTKRYAQCFNSAGATVMPQTEIFARNNDDASMNQDQNSTSVIGTTDGVTRLVAWRGANGNGDDDGWLQSFAIQCDAAGTACTYQRGFEVSLLAQEERSHGLCSVGTDPNTAVCSYTAGNNQPQRDGTWLAAVDITPGQTGADREDLILWKEQIDGRKGEDPQTRTYSMRAMHSRVLAVGAGGTLVPTDDIIWRSGDLNGNNNNNNGKGGTYFGNQVAIITATKEGISYKLPMTNVQDQLLGLDGTHLGMGFAMFGTTDGLKPGVLFTGGSHTGGGYAAKVRAVAISAAGIEDLGSQSIAPYDRHLYSNYLGNNPGNQGRNYSGTELIANPFVGQNGNKDAYLMLVTTTGKDPGDIMRPELKLSSYISVIPLAQTPGGNGGGEGGGEGGGGGTGDGGGNGGGNGGNEPGTTDTPGTDGGTGAAAGCSVPGTSGAGTALLFLGLAAFIARRRR